MKTIKFIRLLFLLSLSFNFFLCSKSNFYGVILAGGSGKRLWPLSRKDLPKQFIEFIDNKTLMDLTLSRTEKIVDQKNICVVTTEQYKSKIAENFSNYPENIIIEPCSRNTGPAILLTCLELYKKDPQAILFFIPADHYIPDEDLFRETIKEALEYCKNNDKITLLGINPTFASTEYGYIEYNNSQSSNNIYRVTKFHEKPSKQIADKYIKSGNMLWNCGIFCAKASFFLKEIEKYAPKLYQNVIDYTLGKLKYESIADVAFDIAVLEKTENCVVIPSYFSWSDVGSLENFLSIKKERSNNKILEFNSSNNLVDVNNNKLTVLMGVENLFVIDTNDVLFVCDKSNSNNIKKLLEALEKIYDNHI